MDTILDNTPGENYFDTRALTDFVSVSNEVCRMRFVIVSFSMDNIIPINQFAAPTGAQLEPLESSKPILTPSYELRPSLINLVQEQSFSGEGTENSYTHLREFEQTCACLHIASMSHETLKWKLFLFSLMGRAKH